MREALEESCGHELVFLPDYDDALVGVATRPRSPWLPVYGWKRALKTRSLEQVQDLFNNTVIPTPLVLMPVNRKRFWPRVGHELLIWDQLHRAIVGLGVRGFSPEVVVYSRPLLVDCLEQVLEPSHGGVRTPEDFLAAMIEPVWLGPKTPYVMQPISE